MKNAVRTSVIRGGDAVPAGVAARRPGRETARITQCHHLVDAFFIAADDRRAAGRRRSTSTAPPTGAGCAALRGGWWRTSWRRNVVPFWTGINGVEEAHHGDDLQHPPPGPHTPAALLFALPCSRYERVRSRDCAFFGAVTLSACWPARARRCQPTSWRTCRCSHRRQFPDDHLRRARFLRARDNGLDAAVASCELRVRAEGTRNPQLATRNSLPGLPRHGAAIGGGHRHDTDDTDLRFLR